MMFEFTLIPPGDVAFSFDNLAGKLSEDYGAEIQAVCSAPPRFAGREATVIFGSTTEFEDAGFLAAKNERVPVGSLHADKNSIEALATIPPSRFFPLMAAIAAGQITYVSFDVGDFKGRRGDAIGYYFEGQAQRNGGLSQP